MTRDVVIHVADCSMFMVPLCCIRCHSGLGKFPALDFSEMFANYDVYSNTNDSLRTRSGQLSDNSHDNAWTDDDHDPMDFFPPAHEGK